MVTRTKLMTSGARWGAAALLTLGAGVAAAVVTSVSCGSGGTGEPSEGGVIPDSRMPQADASADVPLLADTGAPDAAACGPPADADVSDWPGWRRLLNVKAGCRYDAPTDVNDAGMPVSWVPCLNGAPNCLELDPSWPLPAGAAFRFGYAIVSHGGTGQPKWMIVQRTVIAAATQEDDAYDVETLQPLGAWRADTLGDCPAIVARPGVSSVSLFGRVNGCGLYGAHGAPSALMTAPGFLSLRGGALPGITSMLASDTTVAFDMSLFGIVGRWAPGTSSYVLTAPTGTLGLYLEMVEASDVYASSEHGTTGWSQIYRVDPDGSYHLYLSAPNAHISSPRTDGTTLFWMQIYGTTDLTAPQQRVEVWAASYSSDPAQIAANAHKVATIPETVYLGDGVAFGGLYAAGAGPNTYVVRLADGAVVKVSAGPNRSFWGSALVTPTELWALTSQTTPRFNGVAFQRIALGAW